MVELTCKNVKLRYFGSFFKISMLEIYEYKTYTCTSCQYCADVKGEEESDYFGICNTHVCLDCRILIECMIADSKFDKKTVRINILHVDPVCMMCGKSNVILWDSEISKCPKCENKMELSRLELGGPDLKSIKIL